MKSGFPESPEAVALLLVCLILSREPAEAANGVAGVGYIFALFRRALATIYGEDEDFGATLH